MLDKFAVDMGGPPPARSSINTGGGGGRLSASVVCTQQYATLPFERSLKLTTNLHTRDAHRMRQIS